MKKNYVLNLIIFAVLSANAQVNTFQKTFGGSTHDYANSITQTTDGGFIMVGSAMSFGAGNTDIYMVKTDSNGTVSWTRTFGGALDEEGYSVQQTSDGGYIIAGITNSFGAGGNDVYLIKTDGNGISTWSKTIGGSYADYGYSVQQTTDGGYIIAGYTDSYGIGSFNYYLIKTDPSGVVAWTKTFGGSSDDHGKAVIQTSDGGYAIVGYSYSFGTGLMGGRLYMVKTDPSGSLSWSKTFDGFIAADETVSVQETTGGSYVIIGSTTYFGGDYDPCLVKTDANGNVIWAKSYDIISSPEYGHSAQQTSDGGYIICGYADLLTVGGVYLIKTDSVGAVMWSKIYYGSDGRDVKQTIDGGFAATGYGISSGAGYEVLLIKTDANGNSNCNDTSITSIARSLSVTYGSCTSVLSSGGSTSNPNTLTGSGGVTANLCTTVGVYDADQTANNISIYPNPSNGKFTLKNENNSPTNSIEIYNMLGEKIYTISNSKHQNENEIDLSNSPKGIYFVKIYDGEKMQTEKIIIQ